MSDQDRKKTVLVTGATGYIAGHVCRKLLEAGYRVRGTVRSLDSKKTNALKLALTSEGLTGMTLIKADLLNREDWADAVRGCDYVCHVAAMFSVSDDPELIIKASVDGTTNVMQACIDEGVQRVVMTSSVAAVSAGFSPKDLRKQFGASLIGPELWSNDDSDRIGAYSRAKTLAERKFREMAAEARKNGKQIQIATVNPSLVLGPRPHTEVHGESIRFFKNLLDFPVMVDVHLSYVDVRDVAEMHVRALELEDTLDNRFICAPHQRKLIGVCSEVRKIFGPYGYKPAKCVLPDWLVWLGSFFNEKLETMYKVGLGPRPGYDNSRAETILGMKFRPLPQTLEDMGRDLIDNDVIERTEGYKKNE